MSDEYLTLKWGTLKAWKFEKTNERAIALLTKYHELGASISAAMQHDTPEQKQIICDLIDSGEFDTVYLDWDDKDVSKQEAKDYVMNCEMNCDK